MGNNGLNEPCPVKMISLFLSAEYEYIIMDNIQFVVILLYSFLDTVPSQSPLNECFTSWSTLFFFSIMKIILSIVYLVKYIIFSFSVGSWHLAPPTQKNARQSQEILMFEPLRGRSKSDNFFPSFFFSFFRFSGSIDKKNILQRTLWHSWVSKKLTICSVISMLNLSPFKIIILKSIFGFFSSVFFFFFIFWSSSSFCFYSLVELIMIIDISFNRG